MLETSPLATVLFFDLVQKREHHVCFPAVAVIKSKDVSLAIHPRALEAMAVKGTNNEKNVVMIVFFLYLTFSQYTKRPS